MRLRLLIVCALSAAYGVAQTADGWPQWGGPARNFVVEVEGLADGWPEAGPPILWSRPLGLGHSSIAVDEGRLFTMYRLGEDGRAGRWEPQETVIALDAESGETLWEYTYDSEPLNFRYGAGPHATPTVVGDRVFTAGTNKQIHAFDKGTGELLWAHDLVNDSGAPPTLVRPAVKAGYACNPVVYEDTLILSAGGEGQAVMALRQSDGEVVWKSGDFLVAQASPILIEVGGEPQVVVVGGQTVNGLNPDTGEVLWSHEHDTDGDMNNSMPVWGDNNILFVTSAYDAGSRALRVTADGAEELWFNNRFKVMFSNVVRLGDYIYGTSGDFGPAFLTAININTGEIAWQERGFNRSSLLYADGKAIILDEDGTLVLARLSPEGIEELARTSLFTTTAWSVPSLVGTTLYARDREKIVAVELGE